MSDADTYRERAAMAERLAGEMTTGKHRDDLLKIASDWRLMAEKADAMAAAARPDPAVVVEFPEPPTLENPDG